ncbi:hypothetical protein M9Y10_002293 [Tritrichomonas musculus]|uniref:Ubiquitin-conjugating enzyme family protein n=1 Tax=Tritrichomonas musculus TaxID=1915356 RepID=A0ABR2L9E2_9EUKA
MSAGTKTIYYSIDGKEVLSIDVEPPLIVADFIDLVGEKLELSDLNSAYLNGRKLDEGNLLDNYFADTETSVIYVSNNPDIELETLPTFDFFVKTKKDEELTDTISSSSHSTLDENDITPRYGKNNYRIYTTATAKSLLEGDRMVLHVKEKYDDISKKIKTLIQSFADPGIPDDFDIHIFLPSGVLFLPGDDPEKRTLGDFFEAADHSWNRIYVIVTKNLGDFVYREIDEPCNCSGIYKNMISPLFDSSLAGLTQMASFLGYLFHGGIHGEHLMIALAKVTRFAPLFINICRLLEHSQLNALNIISITAPLFTLFKSLLPESIKNDKIFKYTFQILTYINKLKVTDFLDLRTIDLDNDPSPNEALIYEFLKVKNQQDHVIIWGGDIEKDAYEGIILEKPPTDIFTDKVNNIFNMKKTFKPVAPLSLHYIYYPTFVRGEGKNESILFIKEVKNKKNWIEYIDPKIGSIKEISIDDLATKLHNSDKEEFLSLIDGNVVDQIIVICYDKSTSMKFKMEGGNPRGGALSRIQIANRYLHALVDQANSLRVSSIYGLIGFHSEVEVIQGLTAMSSQFLDRLKDVKPDGKTLLYDALSKAQEMILNITKPRGGSDSELPYPNAKLRIIVISDGTDNKSSSSPSELTDSFIKNGIIVDTVLVASNEKNDKMCAISKLTGGLCFQPSNIEEGLKIFEQEAFLNIKMRHIDPPHKTPINDAILDTKASEFNGNYDEVAKNQVIYLAQFKIQLASPLYACYLYQNEREIKTMRSRRALKELNIIGHNPNDNYIVYSSYATPDEWRIFIKGPEGTPFKGKWLNIYMSLSSSYPTVPPSFKFLTIPFHPNVSQEGTIKFSLIDKDYTPKVGIDSIIEGIIQLLKTPDEDSILNKEAATLYNNNKSQYEAKQKAGETGKAKYVDYIGGVKIFDKVPDDVNISKDERCDDIYMTNTHHNQGKLISSAELYEE